MNARDGHLFSELMEGQWVNVCVAHSGHAPLWSPNMIAASGVWPSVQHHVVKAWHLNPLMCCLLGDVTLHCFFFFFREGDSY